MCLSDGVATNAPAWGSFALTTPDADGSLTFRESFAPNSWSGTALDFDELSRLGVVRALHLRRRRGAYFPRVVRAKQMERHGARFLG